MILQLTQDSSLWVLSLRFAILFALSTVNRVEHGEHSWNFLHCNQTSHVSGMAKPLWNRDELGKIVAGRCEKCTLIKSSFLLGKKDQCEL